MATEPVVPIGLGEEVPPDRVRWLYSCAYYDGILSGMVEVGGERLWATCFDESEPDADGEYLWNRRYALHRLSPEVMAAEVSRHELFRECVGHHLDYVWDEGGAVRVAGGVHSRERWHRYYDAYPPGQYADPTGEVIGWFED